MLRAIREIQPTWIVGENVRCLINWSDGLVFEEVQADLEAEGYEVQPFVLPACAVDAPHRRDRIWFIAYSNKCDDGGISREHEGEIKEEWLQERDEVREFSESDKVRATTDTEVKGSGRQHEQRPWQGGLRGQDSGNGIDRFRDFPTKPPICRGDDGVSREMVRSYVVENSGGLLTEKEIDKIVSSTLSKFREEQIKAYGNAVVPQVVLQIFKAIEEYNQTINH